jgi:5-hydroxyisourate hydrolase-like protein (transthyretin family)
MKNKNSFNNNAVPSHYYLSQNYPNPFRERTTIKFCIARPGWVKLIVYDASGDEIKILIDEEKDPGTYEVEFSTGHYSESRKLEAGVYYYRLEAGDYKCEKEMKRME